MVMIKDNIIREIERHLDVLDDRCIYDRITIDIFPAGQLGFSPEEVDAVALGGQDMLSEGIDIWESYVDRLRLVQVPFMW